MSKLLDKAYKAYMRTASPSYRKEEDSPPDKRFQYDADITKMRYEEKARVSQKVREAEEEASKRIKRKY